jgi:hypothetical protein
MGVSAIHTVAFPILPSPCDNKLGPYLSLAELEPRALLLTFLATTEFAILPHSQAITFPDFQACQRW